MDMVETVLDQLAADYAVSAGQLRAGGTFFVRRRLLAGRRVYESDACALRLLSCGRAAVFACRDDERCDALCAALSAAFADADAAWLSEPPTLRALDALLRPFGAQIADAHHYYVPDMRRAPLPAPEGVSFRLLERDALAAYEDDERFCEALAFSPEHPDMLAFLAEADGESIGMAGASADGAMLWQIGVNVEEGYRGRGVGAYLTRLLRDEVLARGRLPFYGTVESHTLSQRVAVAAGFAPAWWELFTESV